METLYGWWSAKAARAGGYSIYKTPDGVRINVTHVTRDPKHHGTMWDDIRFKGEVTEHCRNIKAPDYLDDEIELVEPMMQVHDEITFKVIKNRDPKPPCPLAYTGTGNCTCGKCPQPRAYDTNPFRY